MPSNRSVTVSIGLASFVMMLLAAWCGCGGCENDGGGVMHDSWSPVAESGDLGGGAGRQVGFWTGSRLLVWTCVQGSLYDPGSNTWTAISTDGAPTGQDGYAAVWTGSQMILWGGLKASNFPDSVHIYDPEADAWTSRSVPDAPSGRVGHSAVWTGRELIVWGGQYFDGSMWQDLDTGGIYDPDANSWTTTDVSGAPDARSFHAAVWTGFEMIIWGGTTSGAYSNSGGRYDPANDTWTPTETVGGPEAHRFFTAVWTGTAMLVWGGYHYDGQRVTLLNTGRAYEPVTDAWIPISTAGAPSGRMNHTSVWTGVHMIVWGGYETLDALNLDPVDDTNTGGIYDPDTDSWTATTTDGAPLERYAHVAVWTGSQMIVWGGEDREGRWAKTVLQDGGVYTP